MDVVVSTSHRNHKILLGRRFGVRSAVVRLENYNQKYNQIVIICSRISCPYGMLGDENIKTMM
jgi:hypothetical protein